MKKMNYVRPLAEVIELETVDIITESFSNGVNGSLDAQAKALESDKAFTAAVNGGLLKLN